MTYEKEAHYEDSYTFTAEQGLNIAVAFSAYDTETEPILPPEIGNL